MQQHLSWVVGGDQGTGVDSAATLFARVCGVSGLWVYGQREYHSNIKGDHSYFQVRVADEPLLGPVGPIDILATFDRSTVLLHKHNLSPGGALLFDPHSVKEGDLDGVEVSVGIPYSDLIDKVAEKFERPAAKLQIIKNVLSVAASFGILGFEFGLLKQEIEKLFVGRRAKLAPMNVFAAEIAYQATTGKKPEGFRFHLEPVTGTPQRILVNGVQAIAMGKILAGCRLQTYYPITPAADESEFLESHPESGVAVVQCEDEIAAMGMAIGGGVTGVRASTSTSGPGFDLKTEAIGWAGMNEVPVVVFNYQRGGPATGLPTRHEQGDLSGAVHSGHGDFPRLVIAPADMPEYFEDGFQAFNLADRYQTPVIVLADKALANSTVTIPEPDTSGWRIDRGLRASPEDLEKAKANAGQFKRFRFTEDGISPRPVLGEEGGIYWCTGDEHDEYGHITELTDNRDRMHTKRMRKERTALAEIPEKYQVRFYGKKKAALTFVTWGSPKGVLLEASEILEKKHQVDANLVVVHLLRPFPAQLVTGFLEGAGKTIGVEMNLSGQFQKLLRENTGIALGHRIGKWNGRPMTVDEVVEAALKIHREGTEIVELTHGV